MHPEELESPTYCLGGSRSIPLSYGCMYAVLRSHPRRPKTNTVGLFRRQSLYPAELRVHVCGFEVSPTPPGRTRPAFSAALPRPDVGASAATFIIRIFPALVKPKRMKLALCAQNRKKARRMARLFSILCAQGQFHALWLDKRGEKPYNERCRPCTCSSAG